MIDQRRKINKTIFIGLGGTGQKVLLDLKRKMLQNFNEVPPSIKLLAIDTTGMETHSDPVSYIKNGKEVTERVTFEPNEYRLISSKNANPEHYIGHENIKDWLHESLRGVISNSGSGAKQRRPQGRFSLFVNSSSILDLPRDLVDNLNVESELSENLKYDVQNRDSKTFVHLIFSPAGGTGAGTFIDIANILKNQYPSEIVLYGHMLSPEFYSKSNKVGRLRGNSYASMKEVDYLLDLEASDGVMDNPWIPDYQGGSPKSFLKPSNSFDDGEAKHVRLIDRIVFWGDENMLNMHKSADDILNIMGAYFYQIINEPGKSIEDAMNNPEILLSNEESGNKRCNYMAVGYAEIYLEQAVIANIVNFKVSNVVLNKYTDTNPENATSDSFYALLDSLELREDASEKKNQIINRLYKISDARVYQDSFLEELDMDDPSNSIKGLGDSGLATLKSNLESKILENSENVIDEAISSLQTEFLDRLKKWGGLEYSKKLSNFLLRYFKDMGAEMSAEIIKHDNSLKEASKDLLGSFEEIVTTSESFWPFGKSDRIREACQTYIGILDTQYNNTAEIARRESALIVYNKLAKFIESKIEELKSFENVLEDAKSTVNKNLNKLLVRQITDDETIIPLHRYVRAFIEVAEEDINVEEFADKYLSELHLQKSFTGIRKLISNHLDSVLENEKETSRIVQYLSFDVEDWLAELLKKDELAFKNCINLLERYSTVNCKYNEAYKVGVNPTPMNNIQNLLISSKDQLKGELSIIESNEFKKGFSYQEVNWSNVPNTEDKNRIACVQLRGGFPANSILDVPIWRNQYKGNSPQDSIVYHIDQNFLEVPDLFAEPFAKNAHIYFGIGCALDIIYCKGSSGYKINVDGIEKDLFDRYGKKTDRNRAFNYFKESLEYIRYVKEEYEAALKNDPQGIKSNFFDHFDDLNINIGKDHSDYELKRKVFGKKIISLSEREKDFIIIERRDVANFLLDSGVMDRSDYIVYKTPDGQLIEKYSEVELNNVGI